MIELRDYQQHFIAKTHEALRRVRKVCAVAPCGSGKRYMATWWAMKIAEKGRRLLVATNRRILVDQMAGECRANGVECGVIMGSEPRNDKALVQIASIQTLKTREWKDMPESDWVVIDEAHNGPKDYTTLFEIHSNSKCVGLTATPVGPQGRSLKGMYDEIIEPVKNSELIQRGLLLKTDVYAPSEPDIEGVTVVDGGEFNQNQLGKAVEMCTVFADVFKWWKPYSHMQTVVFSPRVKYAYGLVEQFREQGFKADVIEGATAKKDRRNTIDAFKSGELDVVVSVNVLCLDADTEVLTSRGFVGYSSIRSDDLVANWRTDTTITFSQPKSIVIRQRAVGERMVYASGHSNFRVTEGHDIATTTGKKAARDLVGHVFHNPVSGFAEPDNKQPPILKPLPEKDIKRLVRATSYTYRKAGMQPCDARDLAEHRIRERHSMSYAPVSSLSDDHVRFIGFFVCDGNVSCSSRGGHHFVACETHNCMPIIEWFQDLYSRLDLNCKIYDRVTQFGNMSRLWSFSRGTGFGPQKRNGIFQFEYLLTKDGLCPYLSSLTSSQFDALIDGLWHADGNHLDGAYRPTTIKLSMKHKRFLESLQSVAVCRGYRTRLRGPETNDMYVLTMRKIATRCIGTGNGYPLKFEDSWSPETVWCVTTDSGYIVTRRHGVTCVLGNCEGFDATIAQCGIDLQPNFQLRTYWQKVGRVKRAHEGQEKAIWLDFAGNFWRFPHPDEDFDWSHICGDATTQSVLAERAGKKCGRCGSKNISRGRCQDCGNVTTPAKEPWSCAKCSYTLSPWERLTDGKCPNCQAPIGKAARKIRMKDGRMKLVGLQEKQKAKASVEQAAWDRCRYRAMYSGRTLSFARWMYIKEMGHEPPHDLKHCPERDSGDWNRKVIDVYPWMDRRAAK